MQETFWPNYFYNWPQSQSKQSQS